MSDLIKNDSRLNDATKQEYANVMIECLLEANNNQELSDCIDAKMNNLKVNKMAANDTALDEDEDLGNDSNNNSIHFETVNHTNHNNEDIDQLSKNMYRMEAQRESNNKAVNDYLQHHQHN